MPVVPATATTITVITTATPTTSSSKGRSGDWKAPLIVVCGIIIVGPLELGGMWIRHYWRSRYLSSISDAEEYAANSSVWTHRLKPV